MSDLHCDISELKQFRDMLENLNESKIDTFCRACAKELTAMLLRKVIKRTPVGKSTYKEQAVTDEDGNEVIYKRGAKKGQTKVKQVRVHTGGTLRRGWTGGSSQSAMAYAASLGISHNGNFYTIEVVNPVEYAPYVEFGHRQTPGRFVPAIGKKLKAGWVNGRFMLTISANEIQAVMPAFLERQLNTMLREAFHD